MFLHWGASLVPAPSGSALSAPDSGSSVHWWAPGHRSEPGPAWTPGSAVYPTPTDPHQWEHTLGNTGASNTCWHLCGTRLVRTRLVFTFSGLQRASALRCSVDETREQTVSKEWRHNEQRAAQFNWQDKPSQPSPPAALCAWPVWWLHSVAHCRPKHNKKCFTVDLHDHLMYARCKWLSEGRLTLCRSRSAQTGPASCRTGPPEPGSHSAESTEGEAGERSRLGTGIKPLNFPGHVRLSVHKVYPRIRKKGIFAPYTLNILHMKWWAGVNSCTQIDCGGMSGSLADLSMSLFFYPVLRLLNVYLLCKFNVDCCPSETLFLMLLLFVSPFFSLD